MNAALEYNGKGCLLWSLDCPGAFSRGKDRAEALAKLPADAAAFCRWAGRPVPGGAVTVVQEKYQPDLAVEDADSDILLAGEELPLSGAEYAQLRELVLKSARDLDALYAAVPDPDLHLREKRGTFYGGCPDTACRMFCHTNGVTNYYLGELGVEVDNLPGCYENRLNGLTALEAVPGFLEMPAVRGSYGEEWSLRKALRRFLWHDRIHARAMYRRAKAVWGDRIPDPFRFEQ